MDSGETLFLDFPSFSEGLFIEASTAWEWAAILAKFPFLFGGTFIEARLTGSYTPT